MRLNKAGKAPESVSADLLRHGMRSRDGAFFSFWPVFGACGQPPRCIPVLNADGCGGLAGIDPAQAVVPARMRGGSAAEIRAPPAAGTAGAGFPVRQRVQSSASAAAYTQPPADGFRLNRIPPDAV